MKTLFVALLLAVCAASDPSPLCLRASAQEPARHDDLQRQEIEAGARLTLLKDLAAQHQKRATEGPAAQAQWESDLAKEFSDQAAKEAVRLTDSTRQRLALEEKDPKLKTAALDSNESAYLGKVDGLLLALEQDLQTALANGKSLTSQLVTNTTPEQVNAISLQLSENDFRVRILERERSSLELEKLRFRLLKNK